MPYDIPPCNSRSKSQSLADETQRGVISALNVFNFQARTITLAEIEL